MSETNKPPYERPVIVRHEAGLANKLARVPALRPLEDVDGVPIETLVQAYGSPLFVFSERTLVDRVRAMRDAFTRRWPKVRIAWSYKTNYLDGVCKVFHREGSWAEVVSEMEYDKAVRNGVPEGHIHFNGPFKSEAALERALANGAMVHIDHYDELLRAERIAERLGTRPEVAIRLSVAAEGIPPWTRFGFHLESGQARDAVRRLLAGDRLELVGLHFHLGTFLLDPNAYREATAKVADFANELRKEHGLKLKFLDVGGGFASHNVLHAQYLPADQATPSFDRYAEAVVEGLSSLQCPPHELPTLVLETGRALVDDAGFLVSTVHATRRLPDGRRGVVLDAGVNVLFTSFWYRHDVVPTRSLNGIPEPTVLYGPLCMNIDVVRDALLLPPVVPGDRLVMRNVGAYNVTQWMQFITLRPAVVMVSRDGRHGLLRRAETLEALTDWEEVPEWI